MITKQDLMKMLMSGQSPQQIVMNFLQARAGSNPLIGNIMNLAQQGNVAEIEKIARNLAAQRGMDFDKTFNEFQSFLGAFGGRQGLNK